jgi:transposase
MANECRSRSLYYISRISVASRRSFHRSTEGRQKDQYFGLYITAKGPANAHSYWIFGHFSAILDIAENGKGTGLMSAADQVKVLEKRIGELELENKRLHKTVEYLTRKLFGRSTEKTSSLSLGQMSLFDEAETEADPMAPEPDLKEVQSYRRKEFKGQRMELLKDIPHDKRLCTLDEQDRFCEACNTTLVSVGEEFVRTEIEFIPAKVRVIDYYRETFECRTCHKNGEPYMEKSPMPYPVIQHSMASPSTVAWVMHQKFVNALPLYRQEKEWRTLGVNLSRATMANWILAASRDWLVPLVDLMHQKLLKENYLHADETTVQVMNEEGRKNTTDSYMWVYSSGQHSKHPIRIFEYRPGRSGKYPLGIPQRVQRVPSFRCLRGVQKDSSYHKVPLLDALSKKIDYPRRITVCLKNTAILLFFLDNHLIQISVFSLENPEFYLMSEKLLLPHYLETIFHSILLNAYSLCLGKLLHKSQSTAEMHDPKNS